MSFGYNDKPGYGSTNPRLAENEMFLSGNSEFYQTCDMISSNIFAINNSASTLERALKQIGTANDSITLRDKIHETQQITNKSITATAQSFQGLTSLVRGGDRQNKLQLERLKNEFQDTVKRYSNLQKRVAEKIKIHYMAAKTRTESSEVSWGDSIQDDDRQNLLEQEQQKKSQMQAMQHEVEFEAAMIAERETRVRQIEADILDVNQIFRDLGTMVHEQGEIINSIEGNIEKASHEVAGGRDQLHKASQYQKSFRKKLCILLVILLIVAAIIVAIVFGTAKK